MPFPFNLPNFMQFRHCHPNGLYWHLLLILCCDFLHPCYSRKACAIYSTSPTLYFLYSLSQTDVEVYIRKITAHYFVILIQVEQGFHIFKPCTKTSGTCFCEVNTEVHNHNSISDWFPKPTTLTLFSIVTHLGQNGQIPSFHKNFSKKTLFRN